MWEKKGLIFNVSGQYDWNKSHAQVPVVDILSDKLRIYYAARNEMGKSNISYIEVEKENPQKILFVNENPLLDFGDIGSFDDSGIMPSSIITVGDKKYLYYIGWTTRKTVPYHNAVGLAISDDNGVTFKKYSKGPIITVNHIEPHFSGTAFVLFDEGIYKMWYLSCINWEIYDNKIEPLYNIKYAESLDGINWQQTGTVAIELEENEGGLVSASIIKDNGLYKMWYGRRKKNDYRSNKDNTYRIGYAESVDGKNWIRKDDLSGISISTLGWDSEMISYPYVIKNNDCMMMFYNGNGFGKTGFGYATWGK
jgi:hypothetical protein